MKRILLAALLAAAVATPALANDSTAELAAGGLVLTRTDAIVMKSEVSKAADGARSAMVSRSPDFYRPACVSRLANEIPCLELNRRRV